MTDDDGLADLETFNEAMFQFKESIDARDVERMSIILNRLLSILKRIIETHQLVDSIDVLEYAVKLIYLLQDIHSSKTTNYDPESFSLIIDQLALCLTARITHRFIPPPSSTNDMDETCGKSGSSGDELALIDILMKRADGVDVAHQHAKHLSKYMFSLIHYVEERSVHELEHAERTSKLVINCSLSSFLMTHQFLPGIDLMLNTLRQDEAHHSHVQSIWVPLQTDKFVTKLDTWRTYHDKVRKTVKIQWDKCLKKFQQAMTTVEDARANSKSVVQLPTSSSSSSTSSDPITHLNILPVTPTHGSLQRTASSPPGVYVAAMAISTAANTNLQSALADLDVKREELQTTKHQSLTTLHKLIISTENLIMDALDTYFRLTNNHAVILPSQRQSLLSSYAAYIRSLPPCSPNENILSFSKDNSTRRLPIVIQLCCHCIERLDGHRIRGIYRLSGVKSKVDHICRQFVQGIEINETDLISNYSPIVLASAIKKYLRELPIPLLLLVDSSSSSSSSMYSELMHLAKELYSSGSNQPSLHIDGRLRKLIEQRLGHDARQALVYLLKHLHVISLSEQENQMSPANLGIVFGPTLFKGQQQMQDDSTLSTLLEAPYQAKFVEYLIVNVHTLFNSDV